jgi:serine/threonine protein kinase
LVEKPIDSGTHGQVFEGYDLLTSKMIAVKIVPESKLPTKKFKREINVIKELNEVSENKGFTKFVYKGKSK